MDDRAKSIYIEGIRIDDLTMGQAKTCVIDLIESNKGGYVVTPNPEIIIDASSSAELKRALDGAALSCADGIGVVYASKILGKPLGERVAGFDLINSLLPDLESKGYGLYLFGAKEGVAREAAEKIKAKHPRIKICGMRNGYFSDDETEGIVKDIQASGAALVLVCLGAPKQEIFMNRYRDIISPAVMMGLGGSLDVFAGKAKRAPMWMIKMHIEWLYRLMCQPSRYKRVAKIPVFLLRILFHSFRKSKQEVN